MHLKDISNIAVKSLKSKPARTVLTILGISIGIAIVIVIMSSGRGLNKFLTSQLEIYGSDSVWIEIKVPSTKKTSSENAMGQASGISITTMNDKDIEAIGRHENINDVYGWVMGQEVVSYQGLSRRTQILGNGHSMPNVERFDIAKGRFYSQEEENSLANVVVLGKTVQEKMFGDDDPIGKTIYIKRKPFKVIGLAKERGSAFFMDMDDQIYMPAKTLQKRILGVDHVVAMVGKIKDMKKMDQTVADIEYIMRENHKITDPKKDDFAVSTMEEARGMLTTVLDGLTFLLVALVCISLIVGGVGIMNIMYVSVSERTFEIGLRKALGARGKDIMSQFLFESVMLTMAGGIIGIILGAFLSFIVYLLAVYYKLAWVYSIPIYSVVISVIFSMAVGLFFGLYPARKAASLDPIEALRKE
ncbi:MAG: ABC transporter permease [bacterium]